jgi:4-amino-4-deoxy-L-arabinose transferase-like glycosyltransferase
VPSHPHSTPAEAVPVASRWVIGAIVALPYLLCLDDAPLTETDEAMFAVMARNMVVHGRWLTPMLGDAPWFVQPPLAFWLEALAMSALGFSGQAVRLPSLLCAAAAVALVGLGTRRLWSRDVSLAAAAMLATTPALVLSVRDAKLDAVLLVGLTASLVAAANLLGGATGRARAAWHLLAALGAGWACLTKGFVGVVMPLAAIGLFVVLRQDLRAVWRSGAFSMGLGAVSFAGAYLGVQTMVHGTEFVYEQVVRSQVLRYFESRTGATTPLYYVHTWAWAGFPWSLGLFGLAVAAAWRRRGLGAFRALPAPDALMVAWVGAFFLVFSFSKSKLPQYIFPIAPAAAVLVARWWMSADEGRLKRAFAVGAAAVAAVVVGLELGIFFPAPWPVTLATIAVPVACIVALTRRDWTPARLGWVIVSNAVALALLAGWHYPVMSAWKPQRSLAALWQQAPSATLVVLDEQLPLFSLEFYAGRSFTRVGTVDQAAASLRDGDLALAVSSRRDELAALAGGALVESGPFPFAHVARGGVRLMLPWRRDEVVREVSLFRLQRP